MNKIYIFLILILFLPYIYADPSYTCVSTGLFNSIFGGSANITGDVYISGSFGANQLCLPGMTNCISSWLEIGNISSNNSGYRQLDNYWLNNVSNVITFNTTTGNATYIIKGTKLGNTTNEIFEVCNNNSFAPFGSTGGTGFTQLDNYWLNNVSNVITFNESKANDTYIIKGTKLGNTTDEIFSTCNNGTFALNSSLVNYISGSLGINSIPVATSSNTLADSVISVLGDWIGINKVPTSSFDVSGTTTTNDLNVTNNGYIENIFYIQNLFNGGYLASYTIGGAPIQILSLDSSDTMDIGNSGTDGIKKLSFDVANNTDIFEIGLNGTAVFKKTVTANNFTMPLGSSITENSTCLSIAKSGAILKIGSSC